MNKFDARENYFKRILTKLNVTRRAIEADIPGGDLFSLLETEVQSERDGAETQMNMVEQPTWKLILIVAERLQAEFGDFRLTQIIKAVQQLDPNREWTSIQPVVQGMTANVGKGPSSPCGQPLLRISRGVYRLGNAVPKVEPRLTKVSQPFAQSRVTHSMPRGGNAAERRVAGVIDEFVVCLDTYDQQIPFTRTGQYSLHRATIDKRQSFVSVRDAIEDEVFLKDFHQTLYAWGIGKRASRLVSLPEFRDRLSDCSEEISGLEHLRLEDPELDIPLTATRLWQLIERLGVVKNVSLIVPGTKTLHHLLPDLVPPMDRAWTGAFFQWSLGSPQYERSTFIRTFSSFAKIAQATDPSKFVGEEWRTSPTKVLDNAIIGYCKLHSIAPLGS